MYIIIKIYYLDNIYYLNMIFKMCSRLQSIQIDHFIIGAACLNFVMAATNNNR